MERRHRAPDWRSDSMAWCQASLARLGFFSRIHPLPALPTVNMTGDRPQPSCQVTIPTVMMVGRPVQYRQQQHILNAPCSERLARIRVVALVRRRRLTPA
jgi:hypothetical protein